MAELPSFQRTSSQCKEQASPLSVLGKSHFSVLLLNSLLLYLGFWGDAYLCNEKAGISFSGGAGLNSLLRTTACSHCPFSCGGATHVERWDVTDLS